jgi:type I restriction enzyme R subunit
VAELHNPDLRNFIVDVRKKYDQIIDTVNIDEITNIGWATDQKEQAESTVEAFERWVQEHKDEALALQIFYDAPY